MSIDEILSRDECFRYQLLDRMKQDCIYYLNGHRAKGNLWANDVKKHIEIMEAIWNSFSEKGKPEWLTLEEIETFKNQMMPVGCNKRSALVIVDMQKGFMNEYTKHLPSKIIEFANKGDFYAIIGTRYINHEQSPCYIFEGWKQCMRGSGEEELLPEIEDTCELVIDKSVYSCWSKKFYNFLKKVGIERLVFVGVNTGCCVLHSAFDAYNDCFETIVIKDLCGSTSGAESHNAALKILSECITKDRVITSEKYLRDT